MTASPPDPTDTHTEPPVPQLPDGAEKPRKAKQGPPPQGPLTKEEILEALKFNGFPFEIRLFKVLKDANLDPMMGQRFLLPGGDSAEIDLTARIREPLADNAGSVELVILVEAKTYGEQVNFVGMLGESPGESMRVARLRISGVPTCRVAGDVLLPELAGQDLVQLMLGPEQMAKALDHLNTPPFCVNWVKARRPPPGRNYAVEVDKEDRDWQSFKKLARMTTHLERETARWLSRPLEGANQLRLMLYLPVIIIATPKLYVYDALAESGDLNETQSLIFQEYYEADEQILQRYTDVVTETGLQDFIRRCRDTASGLRDACNEHLYKLIEIAKKQQAAHGRLD